ncbi:SH3 domain protein, partial [Cooperia oncophora]
RRLDYDCKKRQQRRDDELIQAEEKLEESKRLAEMAMFNVLSNDVEQVSQLRALVDAQLDFHRQTTQVLEALQAQLAARVKEASCRPRAEHHPQPVLTNRTPRSRSPAADGFGGQSSGFEQPPPYSNGGGFQASVAYPAAPAAQQQQQQQQQQKPSARAMFDFDAQNEGELNLKEGQVVELVAQVDENWFEGRLNGKNGLFPIAYVQVLVPLR